MIKSSYYRISMDEKPARSDTSVENQKAIIQDFVRPRLPDSTLTFYEDYLESQ